MKKRPLLQHFSRTRLALACVLSSTVLLACGGGGGDSRSNEGSSTSGPGASAPLVYTQGTIEGLGSIHVNGVRFDDSQAQVFDDTGAARSRSDLKLGMLVEVVAPAAQPGVVAGSLPTTRAQEIRMVSELQGPVTAVGADTLTVLGQSIRFDARTVFEDGRAATLRVGQVVEVYGLRDAQGVLRASRIEVEDDRKDKNDRQDHYKLVGAVTAHDPAARTFVLGGQLVSYAALGAQAGHIADGEQLRVSFAPQALTGGAWPAAKIKTLSSLSSHAGQSGGHGGHGSADNAQGLQADIEGYVTRVDGPRRFVVGGVAVDASNATRFPAVLGVGSMVEVEGHLVNGVVIAREVELEIHIDTNKGFEIEGVITIVDLSAYTLQVRGLTVEFAGSRFKDGSVHNLAAGTKIEVTGTLSPDGSRLSATEIDFD